MSRRATKAERKNYGGVFPVGSMALLERLLILYQFLNFTTYAGAIPRRERQIESLIDDFSHNDCRIGLI
jgi:hypothetical protein